MFKFISNQFALLLSIAFVLSAIACDEDNDSNNCANNFNFVAEISVETTALTDAASVYANDPTPENCNAYKVAATAYLDAAADLKTCAQLAGQGIAFDQAVADAQANVDALQCG